MNQFRALSFFVFGPVLSAALIWVACSTTTEGAGLTGSLTSQTFTPKNGTTRAKLEQTLLVSDGLPNNSGRLPWATTTTAELADFLNEGGGNYYLDLTLHVRNQLNGPAPGLGFRSLGVELLDVAGLPLNGSDGLYFGNGPNVESTSFFTNPPTEGGTPPENVIWIGGLLPATAPYTEATFKLLIHVDALDSFGGNGRGAFSIETALTVETVPEPSSLVLAIIGIAGGGLLLRRKFAHHAVAKALDKIPD